MNTGAEILRYVFPKAIWRNAEKKCLYLTFDDGPTPEITQEVLHLLKGYNAKATFFCIGKNVEKHPEIYSEIIQAGHKIGNHTFNHLNGWTTKNSHYYEDIVACGELIDSTMFRPPYGKITPKQSGVIKKEYNLDLVLWDVLSKDYDERLSAEDCIKNVKQHSKSGSIIVFHDSVKAWPRLKDSLPELLEYFKNKGFSFEAL